MEGLTLALLVRMSATAAFVLAMGWLVARARPWLAAAAIAMPVVIGPGYFMLALDRDAAFVMRAAEDGLGALAGTLAFAVVVVLLAGRLGRGGVLALALTAWAAGAALAGLVSGFAGNAALFLAAYAAGMLALRGGAPAVRRVVLWSPSAELLRALAAGALVGGVTLAAERLGPVLTGSLISMPVGMLFVALGVLRPTEAETARRVLSAGARGCAALAMFVAMLRLLLPLGLAPPLAVLAAVPASVALALLLGFGARKTLDMSGAHGLH